MVALLGLLLGCHLMLRRQQAAYNALALQYSALTQTLDAAEPTPPPGVSVTVPGNPENE